MFYKLQDNGLPEAVMAVRQENAILVVLFFIFLQFFPFLGIRNSRGNFE